MNHPKNSEYPVALSRSLRAQRIQRAILSVVALMVTGGLVSANAAEVDYQFGGVGGAPMVKDTMIVAGPVSEGKNYGGSLALLVGAGPSVERRSLIKFDFSEVRKGRVVRDGILQFVQANVSNFREGVFEIGVYAITRPNAGWIEGEGFDVAASSGEPTWKNLAAGENPKPWAGNPGLSQAGVDYQDDPIATITYDASNDRQPVEVIIPVEILQKWIDNPEENAGLILKRIFGSERGAESLGGFFSTNHREISNHPKLTFAVDE